MNNANRDCLVEGYEPIIEGLDLPDPDDRHVLAAAIRCHAQVVVTFNMRHFPQDRLRPYGIEAQTPDQFVHHLIDLAPSVVADVFCRWVSGLQREPRTIETVLALLERDGLVTTAGLLRRVLSELAPYDDAQ